METRASSETLETVFIRFGKFPLFRAIHWRKRARSTFIVLHRNCLESDDAVTLWPQSRSFMERTCTSVDFQIKYFMSYRAERIVPFIPHSLFPAQTKSSPTSGPEDIFILLNLAYDSREFKQLFHFSSNDFISASASRESFFFFDFLCFLSLFIVHWGIKDSILASFKQTNERKSITLSVMAFGLQSASETDVYNIP